MASWRIRFHDKWPHLSTLYTSTHNLDEEGKNPDPLMGIDNVFDPNEPYGAYRYYVQPRSEMSIEEPSYTRGVYKDEESRSRSSDFVSGGSFKRSSACRIILCIFLVVSFIGVVLAAITLAVILSQHNVTRRWPAPIEFDSEMTLNGAKFTDKLRDNTSEEFNALENSFCSALHELFLADDSPIRTEWSGCEVLEFSNGSVVTRFRIFVRPHERVDTEGRRSMEEQLRSYLTKKLNDDGPWKPLKINLDSIKDFVKVDTTGVITVKPTINTATTISGTTTTTTSTTTATTTKAVTTTKEIVNTVSPKTIITTKDIVNTDVSTQDLVITERTTNLSTNSVSKVEVRTEDLGVPSTGTTSTVTGDYVGNISTVTTERQTAQDSQIVSITEGVTDATDVVTEGLSEVISTGIVQNVTDATTKRTTTVTERTSTESDTTLSTTPSPILSTVSTDIRTFVSTLTTPTPKVDSLEKSTMKTLSEGTRSLVTVRMEETDVITEGLSEVISISIVQNVTDAITKRTIAVTERTSTESDTTLNETPSPIRSTVSTDIRTFVSTLTTPTLKVESPEKSTIKILSEGTRNLAMVRTEETTASFGETVKTEGAMAFVNFSTQQDITASNLSSITLSSHENVTEITAVVNFINTSTPIALVSNAESSGTSTTAFTDVVSTLPTELGLISTKEDMRTSSSEISSSYEEDRTITVKTTTLSSFALLEHNTLSTLQNEAETTTIKEITPTDSRVLNKALTPDTSALSDVLGTTLSPEVSYITGLEPNISSVTEIATTSQGNDTTDFAKVSVNTSTGIVLSESPPVTNGTTVSPDVASEVSTYIHLNVSEAINSENLETSATIKAIHQEMEFSTEASKVSTEATNMPTDVTSLPVEVSATMILADTSSNVSDLILANASSELSTTFARTTSFDGTTLLSNITVTADLDITTHSVDNTTADIQAATSNIIISTESVQLSSATEVIITESTHQPENISQQLDNVTLEMDQQTITVSSNETSDQPQINVTLAVLTSTETVPQDATTAEPAMILRHSLNITPTPSAATDAVQIEVTTSEIAVTGELLPTSSKASAIATSDVTRKTEVTEVDRPTITSTVEYNDTSIDGNMSNVSSGPIYNETTELPLAGKEIVSNISAENTDQNMNVTQVQSTTESMITSSVSRSARQTTEIITTGTSNSTIGTSQRDSSLTSTDIGLVNGISSASAIEESSLSGLSEFASQQPSTVAFVNEVNATAITTVENIYFTTEPLPLVSENVSAGEQRSNDIKSTGMNTSIDIFNNAEVTVPNSNDTSPLDKRATNAPVTDVTPDNPNNTDTSNVTILSVASENENVSSLVSENVTTNDLLEMTTVATNTIAWDNETKTVFETVTTINVNEIDNITDTDLASNPVNTTENSLYNETVNGNVTETKPYIVNSTNKIEKEAEHGNGTLNLEVTDNGTSPASWNTSANLADTNGVTLDTMHMNNTINSTDPSNVIFPSLSPTENSTLSISANESAGNDTLVSIFANESAGNDTLVSNITISSSDVRIGSAFTDTNLTSTPVSDITESEPLK